MQVYGPREAEALSRNSELCAMVMRLFNFQSVVPASTVILFRARGANRNTIEYIVKRNHGRMPA